MSLNKIPVTLYHYCNAEAFVNIMQESSFRLSNVLKSNDKEEIIRIQPKVCNSLVKTVKKLSNYFDEHITAETINNLIESRVNDFNKNLYVICFSEEDDLLSNWEMYANKGKGFAIGVKADLLRNLYNALGSELIFNRMCYDEDLDEKTENYLLNLIKEYNYKLNLAAMEDVIFKTANYILKGAAFYKNSKFSSEKEWRLILNPLKELNFIKSYEDYFDRINDIEQYNALDNNFNIGNINFKVGANKNTITSYYPLYFDKIKTNFIRKIIIGPNMRLNPYDFDFRLFIYKCGYKISPQKTSNGIYIKSSAIPYRSF